MTETDEELGNLAFSIDEARKAYRLAANHCELFLKDRGCDERAVERLLVSNEEFGYDSTTVRAATRPTDFGLSEVSPFATDAARDQLLEVLQALYEADADLTYLTTARESILAEKNPDHQRVYNLAGREAVLDIEAKTMRYLDQPTKTEPLVLEVVEQRDDPSPHPDLQRGPTKTRRRERER